MTATKTRNDYTVDFYTTPDYDAEAYEDGEWCWEPVYTEHTFFVQWETGNLYKRDRRYGVGTRIIGETTRLSRKHLPKVYDEFWTCDATTQEQFEDRWHTYVGACEGDWGWVNLHCTVTDDETGEEVETDVLGDVADNSGNDAYMRELKTEMENECFARMGL